MPKAPSPQMPVAQPVTPPPPPPEPTPESPVLAEGRKRGGDSTSAASKRGTNPLTIPLTISQPSGQGLSIPT